MTAKSERSGLTVQSGPRLVEVGYDAEDASQEKQPASSTTKEILTVEEMAGYLAVGRSKAYELTREPGFPALRLGKVIRIPKHSLDQWIEDRVTDGGV